MVADPKNGQWERKEVVDEGSIWSRECDREFDIRMFWIPALPLSSDGASGSSSCSIIQVE